MSPETVLQDITVLEESARIEKELVPIELEAAQAAHKIRVKRLQGAREKMGYSNIVQVDASKVVDVRIDNKSLVVTPDGLYEYLPLTQSAVDTTLASRHEAEDILKHKSNRFLAIAGPCSIHNAEEALVYADFIRQARKDYGEYLEIIVRTYMEKPRTEKDWKGYIYDPKLDDSDEINLGVIATRMLALQIAGNGVPIAMERLNAQTPLYVDGLVAYDAIGARNTSDQKAREYASSTSAPVGFKNTVDGNIQTAVEAIVSARSPHAMLGSGTDGGPYNVKSTGNSTAHLILRGDQSGPNYSSEHVTLAKTILSSKSIPAAIIIDASHGNSGKKAENQPDVIKDVSRQLLMGETAIRGVMLESYIMSGNQPRNYGNNLEYGVSITDECIDLETTKQMFDMLADAVAARNKL